MPSRLRLFLLAFLALSCSSASAQKRCFMVFAGVCDYAPGAKIPPLRFPARDARNMAHALRIGAESAFGKANAKAVLLTGERNPPILDVAPRSDATKANFVRIFSDMAQKSGPDDTVIVFLAGHGVPLGEGEYAYLTQDAAIADLANSPFRGDWTLSGSELLGWMRAIRARNKILILDTCAAGAFGEAPRTNTKNHLSWELSGFGADVDFPVLMASASNAASHESLRFGHGLMTFALLEEVHKRASLNEPLKVKAWFETATKRVVELATELKDVQEPRIIWPQGLDTELTLGQLGTPELALLPPLRRTLLLVEPRFSTRDDPGNALDLELEKAVLSQLQAAEKRGEVQLLKREHAANWPESYRISGIITRHDGQISLDCTLRNGEKRVKWNSQGTLDQIEPFASHLSSQILQKMNE